MILIQRETIIKIDNNKDEQDNISEINPRQISLLKIITKITLLKSINGICIINVIIIITLIAYYPNNIIFIITYYISLFIWFIIPSINLFLMFTINKNIYYIFYGKCDKICMHLCESLVQNKIMKVQNKHNENDLDYYISLK